MLAELREVTVGMAWICLDSQSMTTRITLNPRESGSSPITLTLTIYQNLEGTVLGISFPMCLEGKLLAWLQESHLNMNIAT